MSSLTHELEEYIERHTTPMDEVLEALYRETHLTKMNPRMVSGPMQGRFLQMLCAWVRPRRVLEIGTFTGFSTICMARGLAEGGQVITIEAEEENETIIRKYLERAGVAEQVYLIMGDAKEVIPTLEDPFDLVYIDADKANYPLYFEMVIDKLKAGGILLADNVLWDGKVLQEHPKERDTQAIQTFNDLVHNDPRLTHVLLPFRDGMLLGMRNSEFGMRNAE